MLRDKIAKLVVGPPLDHHITDGYWLADAILALVEKDQKQIICPCCGRTIKEVK